MRHTLSKSDFKLARSCATKLYYKELGYPQNAEGDPYLEMLAEGGYMVEQLARLMHPDGRELAYGRDSELDAAETAAALAETDVTLFEATLLVGKLYARVDILRKRADHLQLIEVKSVSYDSKDPDEGPKGPFRQKRKPHAIIQKWRPYLEDVAFQVYVLRKLYPELRITPYLVLVDNSKKSSTEGLPGLFEVQRNVEVNGRIKDLDVRFIGNPSAIDPGEFLSQVDVSSEVDDLLPEIAEDVQKFEVLLADEGPVKASTAVSWDCRDCEYRGSEQARDGFLECWQGIDAPEHHIFDLYRFGHVKSGEDRLADLMIRSGKTGLFDVDSSQLVKRDGSPSAYSFRQEIQIQHTRSGTPWIGTGLANALRGWKWPLHFIDFETSALAIPYHAGMHPYETVGFQWSCHTISGARETPSHLDWLNTKDTWPCLEFARTLRQAIGDEGTVLMWSHHERTTMKTIQAQMERYDVGDEDLRDWIGGLVGEGDVEPRLFDMNRLCEKEFFHPGMKGRTSIKVVLDALWKTDPIMRDRYREWTGREPDPVIGPYEGLAPITLGATELNVFEGTGAVHAYQAMLYGAEKSAPEVSAAWRSLLLRYCELDTLAMVLIWDHWQRATEC